jgi:hypothetical protein
MENSPESGGTNAFWLGAVHQCLLVHLRLFELAKKKEKKKNSTNLKNMVEPTSFGLGQCANACLYMFHNLRCILYGCLMEKRRVRELRET